MSKKVIPESELIINPDGSIFHLHLLPEQLTDRIILVGDPGRVDMVASFFDTKTFEVSAREFHTIGGTYKGKPIMCISHGIGPDNIDFSTLPGDWKSPYIYLNPDETLALINEHLNPYVEDRLPEDLNLVR